MSLNFPNTPTDGQTFTDASGQQWVYEASTNSWTAVGQQGGGISYRGTIDVTAAAPAGVKSGWMYSVSTGGTPDASFNGLADPTAQGSLIIYDGAKWENISSVNIPLASELVAGVVELATAAETTAGTDATRAVHPAGLKVELDKKVGLAGDTMTGNLTVPSLNSGPLAGFRNLLINGGMDVWQRGAPFAADVAGYTADRWFSTGSLSRGEFITGQSCPWYSGFFMVFNGATTGPRSIVQPIEIGKPGTSGPLAVGKTYTLSWWNTDSSGNNETSVALGYNALGVAFKIAYSLTGNATFTEVSNNYPAATTVETSLIGGFTWYRRAVTFTVTAGPTLATANSIKVGFTAQNNAWLGGIQLEPGPVPTPFERRPIQVEIAMCKRYFNDIRYNVNTTFTDRANTSFLYPQMRRAPDFTFISGNATWGAGGSAPITGADAPLVQVDTLESGHHFAGASSGTPVRVFGHAHLNAEL